MAVLLSQKGQVKTFIECWGSLSIYLNAANVISCDVIYCAFCVFEKFEKFEKGAT